MEKRTIIVEQSEAWEIGFNDGLNEGVDTNPYKKDFERYCYRRGYDAGVTEYCYQNHPEDKKCLTT